MPIQNQRQSKRKRVESPVESDEEEVDQLLPSSRASPSADHEDLIALPKTWAEVRSIKCIAGLSKTEQKILQVSRPSFTRWKWVHLPVLIQDELRGWKDEVLTQGVCWRDQQEPAKTQFMNGVSNQQNLYRIDMLTRTRQRKDGPFWVVISKPGLPKPLQEYS